MFDDLVECSPTPKKTSKRWTVILSAVVQCAVLAVLGREDAVDAAGGSGAAPSPAASCCARTKSNRETGGAADSSG